MDAGLGGGREGNLKLTGPETENGVTRFAGFVLDERRGGLFRDGAEVRLRPKAYDFVRLVVGGAGRLFSKDELIEILWPDVIVSDESLTQLVSTVRAAMGDRAGRIIVTVPKRGYRLGVEQAPRKEAPAEVRYAQSGEVSIAWQTVGAGDRDLVYVPGWVSHLEYGWEQERLADFYRRLADFSRLILFDKRGTGLSDRTYGLPTIEQRMDDVRAVMDAAGSKRAAVLAMSEGCAMSMVFAATFPERVSALVIDGGFACREWRADYPWAPTPRERQVFFDDITNGWGGPIGIENIVPSLAGDEDFRAWWGAYQRRSASPAAALALAKMNTAIDVRGVLNRITTPTLVLHRRGDREVSLEEARYLAERIPGAELAEMDGEDHLIFASQRDEVVRLTRDFVRRYG